jgi:ATP-dependent Clp protease ATP-binding subunit ClpA
MNFSIPVYVESVRSRGSAPVYQARPLFFPAPVQRGERLERLLARLARDLAQTLAELGRQSRHDGLAAWTFHPALRQQRIELTIPLRRRTSHCRFLFVVFRALGRRLAFTPAVPEVWFDVARGESLSGRAAEALTRHFRELERVAGEDEDVDPARHSLTGTAYVTTLELTVRPPITPPPVPRNAFFFLGDQAPPDGARELRRAGRCLDWLYPDALDRVLLRDGELDELTRLLRAPEQRPVLLVGSRQVGKTALVHECVWRAVAARRSPFADRGNVWLLAPARLISGMSYVGQWENRLLAILKEARRRRHVLYFDDLIGLFLAGVSSCSSLSVADVLKPYLERGEVRVLGEITPEALRVLRERDRGFADLFHLLPVREPTEEQTLRILISVQRQLEARHRCRFSLDVLPVVHDLQRRYARGVAFPGKAAGFLRQLAVKFAGKEVSRDDALREFHLRSGVALGFLDRRVRLERREVLEALGRQVVGQDAALEAAADVLAVAKARLNDPGRPLGVFLFLGPTGVGKTESARAVARYLFGDAERLLRFDLNEYGEPGAAARLVGTFGSPEGLLTSAIRRQPFAVVLFDEVEKAHPEVFDLLLQVLGEGRLTDALGRTADFSNALIVLTSNLGVRESEGGFGLRQEEAARDAVFVRAAERFFRPEFFNRLDRVIPFRRLSRDDVRGVARKVLAGALAREGLVQRKCLPAVEGPALERIVDQGYDPVLGARALKRAVERQLVQPVGERLAALPPGSFTVLHVYPGPNGLRVEVRVLEQAAAVSRPAADPARAEEVFRGVRAAARRVEDEFAALKPEGPVTLGQVRPEHYRYFALREQAEEVRLRADELSERLEADREAARGFPSYNRPDTPRRGWKRLMEWGASLREITAALDINEYLHDLAQSARAPAGPAAAELSDLLDRAALLQLVAQSLRSPQPERVVVWAVQLGAPHWGPWTDLLVDGYEAALPSLGLEVHLGDVPEKDLADSGFAVAGHSPVRFLTAQGPHALPLLVREAGVHLHCPEHDPVLPAQVLVLPVPEGLGPDAVVRHWLEARGGWLKALARGEASVEEDPWRPGPVIRVWSKRGGVLDLCTGLTGDASLAACLLASLPLPPEVVAGL